MTHTEKLPPLPEPAHRRRSQRRDGGYDMVPAFTATEMRAYAQAALDALADEAEASIKEMVDKGLGQLTKEKT